MLSITLLAVLLSSGVSSTIAQKPVVRSAIKGDSFRLIDTLADLTGAADAVVVARVVRNRDVSTPSRARTEYRLQLVSKIKEHRALSEEVTVLRPTGRMERPDKIIEQYQAELPDFENGGTYLLFLKWHESTGGFWMVGNAQGTAQVTAQGRCKAFGKDAIGRSLDGKEVSSVEASIRSHVVTR